MKINLATDKGAAKLQTILDDVQKHCTARTINSEQVVKACRQIENELDIPKIHLNGTRVELDINAQNFPKAYKYTPESTIVNIEYYNKHWIATDVRRDRCHTRGNEATVFLSDNAKNAIINRFSSISV